MPANKPDHNLEWASNGMYARTKQATVWPAGSWDVDHCYRRAIITAHKVPHGQGTPQSGPLTKFSLYKTEGGGVDNAFHG